jgi:hypothetical protein
MTSPSGKKVLLLAQLKDKSHTGKTFELTAGMGDAGKALRIRAESETLYELQDWVTRKGPNAVRAKRAGKDLEIFLEDSTQPDAVIEGYYDEALVALPGESLVGMTPSGNMGVYVIDEVLRPALSQLSFDATPIVLKDMVAFVPAWLGAAAAAGALAITMAADDEGVGDLLITGKVTAGPVKAGVKLVAYDQDGKLLGSVDIAADGSYRITATGRGDYRGTVLLKALDVNDAVPNYLDEASGSFKSLNTELRALGLAQPGAVQFNVTGDDAHLVINISPLTELAVRQAGVVGNTAVAPAVAQQANDNVANAFGLTDASGKPIEITGDVVPTNSPEFNAGNGLSNAEKQGLALAKLSGLDALNSGNMSTSLDLLASNLNGDALNPTGQKLVDQGRAQALTALKASSSTFNAGTGDADTNTALNRQLLGDIVVGNQTLDSSGRLVVSGTALPNTVVAVTLPDGSTQNAQVDASGNFSLTSAAVQPQLSQPVKVSGSDALAAPVAGAAPNVPALNATNGKLLTGQGDPGTTVEIFAAGGLSLGTTVVDALGNWSLVPLSPVTVGTALKATARDASGNASGPGAGTSTANAVVMSIAEASDGYINAAEKSSNGGVPISISLPTNAAVGDVVQSIVTLPNGDSLTLSMVLGAAEVAAGSLSQLISSADLAIDGLYQVSTTLTHGASTSAPSQQNFLLDVRAPAAPTIAPTNGQVVYGNAEPGSIVKVYDASNQLVGTVGPVGSDGNWTLIPATPLSNNATVTATATATATDSAGNTSAPGTGQVSAGALLITGAVDNAGANLGLLLDGAITDDSSPQISGSLGMPLSAGQTLVIYRQLDNGQFIPVGDATVSGTTWKLQDNGLLDGNYTYQARIMSGSTALQTSGDFNLTVLTQPLAAPATTVPEANDRLVNGAERLSDAGVPVITQLPALARVGDLVSTTITLPNGSSLTLSTTLSLVDIQTGFVSQLIAQTVLGTDGNYAVKTTYTSSITGLPSAPTDNSFTLDTSAPAAGTGALATASDTGTLGDNKTNDNTPALSGTAEANATVQVVVNGQTYTVTANPQGAWSLPATATLPDGIYTPVITVTDAAGNSSTANGVAFTVDTSLPAAGTGALAAASDTGTLGDNKTNDNTPALSGTAEANATVSIVVNGQTYTVTANAQGAWSLPATATLPDGTYTPVITVTDAAGNSSTANGTPFTVDASAPSAPAVALPESSNGVSAAEAASLGGTPIVTTLPGNAKVGDTVTTVVTNPNGTTITLSTVLTAADLPAAQGGTATGAGPYSISQLIPSSALTVDGAWTTSTNLTDVAGNTSGAAAGSFTLDTTAPAAGTGALANASDTGTVGDHKTNDNTPALSGTAEANATVQVVVNGQTYTVTANAQGAWSLPATATLPDGAYTPVITVTDAAGNSSTANGTPFTVDASAPAAPGVQIPDAAQGVSATEAADGVALVVNLPNDAVAGDTLTSVVTKPDGSKLTLTRVLTAADITAGQFTQTVAQAELLSSGSTYRDGLWTTATTLTDVAGNISPTQANGFKLAANGPTLSLNTAAGDGTVNALEKAGDLPLSGSTTAEPGQAVTVQLLGANSQVIGTFYAIVQPNGSFALNIPQAQLPADGNYTLTANVSNLAGTAAAQQTQPLKFDTTAPSITVTSVAGDAVTASSNGTFDGTERGFDTSTYALSNTVATLPVISDTTTAEVGQTVKVLFNNVSYTTTVLTGGTWSVTLTQAEAKALVHGSSYAISASVSDVAGNPATPDTDNQMVVNIAPPDVPTVVPQYAGTTTPVITGMAQKLNAGNAISLAAGDSLTVAIKDATGTTTLGTYTLSVGGTSSPAGLSYNTATGAWSLAVPAGVLPAGAATYNVDVSSAAAGVPARSDISSAELVLDTTPPVITLNPISPHASGASVVNGAEQGQSLTLTGTTTAQVGSTVTLTGLDGVTRTATVEAGTNGLNTFSIAVPGTAIDGMADGTYTPQVSVTNLFGLTGTDTESLLLDTAAPTAPTVALPEAVGGINAAEALSNGGTPLIVTLPADAKVGDTVTTVVTNPNGSTSVLTHVIAAGELPAAQGGTATGTGPFTITQTIASSALTVDGNWTTRTTVTDTAGNASAPQSGAFVLDTSPPGTPGVALPEASNGVNAAEALSNGGTPIAVTLPGDAAVGDTVTTVVTLPDGSTLTLSQVLTAADISAGAISQTIPASALTLDGTWATSTTVTDISGNASAPRAGSFVLDTTPPAAPAAALALLSDSGTVGDSITADTTPTISGTGTPGDTITVTFPGGEVKTAVVAADGSWSVTPTTALNDGVNNVSVTATDPAGNTSPASQLPLTIDTSAPAAPTAVLASVSDTGTLGDSLTRDNTPTLSGSGNPGDTITVKNAAGTVIATAVVNANGSWAATPTTALPDGLNNLAVTAADPAGNTSPATALPITIDTAAPNAPAAALAGASDTGTAGDSLTSDNTPSITGAGATPGDTITVTFPGGEVQTVVVAANGTWTVTPTNALPDGLNTLSVTATDPAGNTSPATSVPLTIDTTPPAAPAAALAVASDSGTLGDSITSDNTPTISGAGATPGDTITLYAPNGVTVLGTAVVAAGGTWAITPTTALADGLNALSVKATDPAGNTSAATPVPVTIDTTAPAAPTVAALLSNDSTPVLTGTATLGAGETLNVSFNGATYNVTVGVGGNWSLDTGTATPASGTLGAFVSGSIYPVTAIVTDAAGNATSDATTGEFGFSNSAPTVPTVNSLASNTTSPVITGVANVVAGETLSVQVNGATYNVTVAGNGTWSVDTATATPASGTLGVFVDGSSYPVTATVTNAFASTSVDTSTNELRIDTTAPNAPAAALAAVSDSGTLGDSKTSDTTPTISGVAGTPGDTITVTFPGGEVKTAVVDANGNWSVTPTTALPQGVNNLSVTATDPAGNVSPATALPITIDTAAPAAPTAVLDASSDSGTPGDSKTRDTTPTLSGTGEPDATITVKDANGNVIATAVVAPDGTWNATPTTALPQGVNNLAITATDAAGNTSTPAALPITIDTTAPVAPTAALLAASDTGIAGDAITADNTPTLTGAGTPGDTITLYAADGSTVLGTTTVANDGTWSVTPIAALADGLQNLQVKATDPAGNTGPATTVPVTIDTTAPNAPAAALASVSDSGTLGDSTTTDTTPTIQGTGATPGDTITLYAPNGTTVLGTAVVAADGTWAITPTTALADGVQNLQVTATDPQGNVSAATTLPITIDTTAPAAPVAALASTSDSGAQGDNKTNDTTPTLSGTGEPNATITVKDANGNVIATATVAADGSWSATPSAALPQGVNNLAVTATDAAGNTSAPTTVPVTIDTAVAAPAMAPSNGIGAVSGTGEPGATVTLMDGSTMLGTAVVAPDGTWSVPLSAALANATALSATAVDAAGNTSAPGTSVVDTTMPDINPTNGAVLTGTGKPGNTIALTLADGTVLRDANGAPLTAVVDGNGNWTATPGTPLPDGAVVKATDTTNNLSATEVVDATPPAAPAAALAAISDSGTLGDGKTNDTTPTLSGTGTPGDTITVKDANGTTIATAVVDSQGQWTATPTAALPEGLNTLAVTATDPVGNVSAPTSVPITIDTTAPTAPAAPDMTAATDSGNSSTDNNTGDTTPDFNVGVVPAGTTPVLYVDGVAVPATVSVVGGNTILTPVTPLTEGAHSITTGLVDAAGNTSAPSPALAVTIDTTAPTAPAAPDMTAATDSGSSSTDNATVDTTPDFNVGVVPAGTTPVLYVDGVAVPATATTDGNGNTILTPVTPLTEGAHNITTGLVDTAGNTSAPGPALAVTIDTAAPAAPAAPDLTAGTDTGSSSTDNNTGDNTPDFNVGVVPAGTTPVLYVDGVAVPATVSVVGGNTILTPVTPLTDGAHSITTGLVDTAGNTSAPSPALAVTIDTAAPAAPAAPDLTTGTDTGSSSTDNNTGDNTPTFAGTGSPGDTITIKDGTTVLGTAVVAPDGTWTFTAPAPGLTDGVHQITTTVTDPAGNTSAPSPALAVTIDATAPAAPVIAPTNGAAITGTGEPGSTVTVMNGSTPVGTAVVAPDGSWTITPSSALPNGTQLTATQVDAAGNISGPDTETVDASVPSVPDLTAGTDSGNSTDNNTNVNTPIFTGNGTPGETVTIKDGSTVLGTAVVAPNGTWTFTSPVLTDGVHQITTTPASGITSPALTVTIDTTAPAAPAAPDLTAGTDTGSSSTDDNTGDNTPTFAGTGSPGDTITIKDGTTVLGTAVVAPDGTWTFTSPVLTEGVHQITTTATDTAGNTSAPSPALAVTIDTTAPAAPAVPDLTAGTDTGSSNTDNTTGDSTPTFAGTGSPGDTVTIKDGSTVLGTAVVAPDGTWTFTAPAPGLTDGVHQITTTVTDPAGNTSAPSPALAVTIDTAAPAAPAAPDLTTGTDTGSSSTDNHTGDNTPDFNVGVVPAGTTPVLYVDGVAVPATATTDGSGNTILTPVTPLTDGAHSITTGLVDTAGNTSAPSPALAVTIDATAPATPAAPDLTAGTDTGSSSTDNNTGDNTPTFAGTGSPGDTITIKDGTTVLGTAVVATDGTWTFTSPVLTDGVHQITTTATDTAGNTSAASPALAVTVDTTAPTLTAALNAASDSGTVGDGITSDTTPTLSGTGTNGDTITVVMPGSGEVLTAVVVNGVWSVTPTYALVDGTVGNAVVTATDTAGNVSAPANVPLDIRSAPVAVAITSITNDTGTSSTDGVTTDTTPTISGTSDQPNRPVTLTIAGVSFVVMTDTNGAWSVDTGVLAATSGTWDPALGFTIDGLKAITVTVSGGNGGTGTASGSVTLDTAAPTVLVNSVFGDAVGASGNGTFDGTERGFNTTTYALSSTVAPLPVISGTTTAENGQTVTVTLNGKSYTATAASGAWQVEVPSADAVQLNHGNTYAISASVSDKAGNAAVPDTNNGVLVNIAPPDVPTVVSQSTLSTTPTITGVAQKLNGASPINLAAGDALTVVLKDAAGTTTLGTYTLTVGGTSSPAGLSYNTSTGAWSLAVPASVLSAGAATYNVDVSATAAGLTRSDISSSELVIAVRPTITSIPEGPTVNMSEATSSGGTPVNVGLTGTGAVAGQVITVTWGGQTYTQVLTAADIAANSVAVIVPTSVIQAETPANTSETINVSCVAGQRHHQLRIERGHQLCLASHAHHQQRALVHHQHHQHPAGYS